MKTLTLKKFYSYLLKHETRSCIMTWNWTGVECFFQLEGDTIIFYTAQVNIFNPKITGSTIICKRIHNIRHDEESNCFLFNCAFGDSLYAGTEVLIQLYDSYEFNNKDMISIDDFSRLALNDKIVSCKIYIKHHTDSNIMSYINLIYGPVGTWLTVGMGDLMKLLPTKKWRLTRIHNILINDKHSVKFNCAVNDSLYAGTPVLLSFFTNHKIKL